MTLGLMICTEIILTTKASVMDVERFSSLTEIMAKKLVVRIAQSEVSQKVMEKLVRDTDGSGEVWEEFDGLDQNLYHTFWSRVGEGQQNAVKMLGGSFHMSHSYGSHEKHNSFTLGAPWQGGVCKRMARVVKRTLQRTLEKNLLEEKTNSRQ
ncbi:hypothetical protein DINM_000427 [Dirofilaria immitis]|nr:hypothetical protein [Dirofilaria immitis]